MDTRLLFTRDRLCYNVSRTYRFKGKQLVTIIATEQGTPQVFVKNNILEFVPKLKEYIDYYKEIHGDLQHIDALEENFMTASKFSLEIENIVKDGSLNYIEAIVMYCE